MEPATIAEQLDRYRDYFPGPHLAMVLASIAAGNTEGRLWKVAQRGTPPLLLLWDMGNNVFYLAGECDTPAPLADIVATQLRPLTLAAGRPRFKVSALSPSLAANLERIFPGVDLRPYPTLFFVRDAETHTSIQLPQLPDVDIVPITPAALSGGHLEHSEYVRAEIGAMWPSEDRFFAHGFGVIGLAGDEIICWCTSEYVGPTHCGVGIETAPQHQRRGVATAVAASFVREAQGRGITPCWECHRENLPSVRVARKLGFTLRVEERFWAGSFGPVRTRADD